MSEENKPCECGDPECNNGKGWEDGVEAVFDRAFDLIGELAAKGEKPIALCVFSIGDKGNLCFETAGVGPAALTEMILSEACVQVADRLQDRAMNTPGFKDMMAKMEAAGQPSQD